MPPKPLPFEKDIHEVEESLGRLESDSDNSPEAAERIRQMRRDLTQLKRERYSKLTEWQTVLVARHPQRPQTCDYINMVFEDFVELHGDRAIGDDRAIRCGFARLGGTRVILIGHQKGRDLQERQSCYYGCAHPEGYRKAMRAMKLGAKFGLPVVCLIDTPGAFPGIGAEERGQSQLIATSLLEMSRLPTPVVCIVIGEGGSGGALAIGVGDRVSMLQHAWYSVISPEGCAGILWKVADEKTKPMAASALKITSDHLRKLDILDEVIPEPLGGAHRDPREMANTLKSTLSRYLRELTKMPLDQLLEARYQKFRLMGQYIDTLPPEEELSEEAGTPEEQAAQVNGSHRAGKKAPAGSQK